jgi:hypothetical protein
MKLLISPASQFLIILAYIETAAPPSHFLVSNISHEVTGPCGGGKKRRAGARQRRNQDPEGLTEKYIFNNTDGGPLGYARARDVEVRKTGRTWRRRRVAERRRKWRERKSRRGGSR